MATYASAPRAPHHLAPAVPHVSQHQQRPLPTKDEVPPPVPKSPPPAAQQKARKIVLPSPPQRIFDAHRNVAFERISFLGEGGFARVYEVSDAKHNHHAVKVVAKVNLQSKKSKTKLYAEIRLHRMLKHPNIVLFGDCFEDNEHVYMSMELCENGSLNDLLRRRKRYTEPETRFIGMQLIGACHYMHTHQVIHRDLKLGNLFLDRDMNVKVGDFGLAALIETPGDRKKTICGTPNYIAPEVLFDTANGHSFEVDTWSIGVILYTLLIGKPPFQTNDVKSIYERIKKNNYEFPPNKPVSQDAQNLITDILTHDPKKRPSLVQIIEHDFFTKGIFPPFIPVSAHDGPPNFTSVTRQQSKANYIRVRRACLFDAEDTEILAVDVPDSGSQMDAATIQQQKKQEREFLKAVQPGSPISVLLRSAREPLLVTKSPLRASHRARENEPPPPPLPTNKDALLRKLSAAAPKTSSSLSTSSTPFPLPSNLEEVDPVPVPLETTTKPHRRTRSGTSSSTNNNGMPPPPPPHSTKGSVASSKAASSASSPRQPLQSLPTLQEEQDEARRQYDLASQKARIVAQMARVDEEADENGSSRPTRGKEREQRDRRVVRGAGAGERERERERPAAVGQVPVGKGLADEETASIKPIRETPRKERPGRTKAGNVSVQGGSASKLQGYEEFSSTLTAACKAVDELTPWRRPDQDADLQPPRTYIKSWVDYCNKYGMGYGMTNGCIGVHFNDSTSLILAPDKHHIEYLSSRRNGVAYVRKNYTVDDFPSDLRSKVYLLRHFERYMLDKLIADAEDTFEELERTSDLPFVHKYLRMTNVLLFKLSHGVLQFNFFDHTKLVVSHGGLHLLYIDKHGDRHPLSLSSVVHDALHSDRLADDAARKFNGKLVRKIQFCKDLLLHILAHSGSRVEDAGGAAGDA